MDSQTFTLAGWQDTVVRVGLMKVLQGTGLSRETSRRLVRQLQGGTTIRVRVSGGPEAHARFVARVRDFGVREVHALDEEVPGG